MIDLTGTNDVPKNSTAVAMGLFDGIHHGHRTVIRSAIDIAEQFPGIDPAVFTFDTATVTSKGEGGVKYIHSRDMKFELIDRLGVRYIYSPDFLNFKNLSGEEFVELVLCDELAVLVDDLSETECVAVSVESKFIVCCLEIGYSSNHLRACFLHCRFIDKLVPAENTCRYNQKGNQNPSHGLAVFIEELFCF